MKITEIINKFKSGDSTQKLGIISDLVSIFSALATLVTAQFFAFKFVITETTIIKTAFYILAMGISLLAIFFYLKTISYIRKELESFMIQLALILILSSLFILLMYTLWILVLTVQ